MSASSVRLGTATARGCAWRRATLVSAVAGASPASVSASTMASLSATHGSTSALAAASLRFHRPCRKWPLSLTPFSTLVASGRGRSFGLVLRGGGGIGGRSSSSGGGGGTGAAANAAAKADAQASKTPISPGGGESEGVPVGKTLIAMTAAVATVSAGAALVESATSDSVLPFDPRGQRFDQSTFLGRFSRMFLACDPSLLLHSGADVRRCREMVSEAAATTEGSHGKHDDRTLWEAQRVASASLHPDSGDTIPYPFRMSGYVPFNGPICVAMVASTSTPALLFWSWVNQSQNALVNYYNRNASSEMSNETLVKSYVAAVGAALTVAFGLATFIQRRYDPAQARLLMRYVAFPSAVVASSLNCYIVRSPEIDTGVPLLDSDGRDVLPGVTSKEAAARGVYSTTASRAILQAPVYFLPPVLLSAVPFLRNYAARNPAMMVPMTTYLLLVSFGFGLPATVAIFPQLSEISVADAEEDFKKLVNPKTGLKYDKFWYNKGL